MSVKNFRPLKNYLPYLSGLRKHPNNIKTVITHYLKIRRKRTLQLETYRKWPKLYLKEVFKF